MRSILLCLVVVLVVSCENGKRTINKDDYIFQKGDFDTMLYEGDIFPDDSNHNINEQEINESDVEEMVDDDGEFVCPEIRDCGYGCCQEGDMCYEGRCVPYCADEDKICGSYGEVCCTESEMCLSGACVAQCENVEKLCGEDNGLCCGENEVCYNGEKCISQGDECEFTEQCEIDEYCEPTIKRCVKREDVEVCEYRPPVGEFDPITGCVWKAPSDSTSSYTDVVMTPVVANITDDNGDGKTDTEDTPDIIITSFDYVANGCCTDKGMIRIIEGKCNKDGTMNTIATIKDEWIDNSGGIAVANLDPDEDTHEQAPEIVAVFKNGGTIAYKRMSSDGLSWTEMWRNEQYLTYDQTRGGTQPSIADLDGDGKPEVIVGNVVLNGQDGTLIWDGDQTSAQANINGGVGNNAFLGPVSTAADIDLDGVMEVIAGNTVYNGKTGAVKWHYEYTSSNSACQGNIPCDGFTAVGNFDDDDFAEVVIVRLGEVFLLNHDGTLIDKAKVPVSKCSKNESGPPTIADFDGDGKPEIGTAGADFYIVFDFDCVGDPLPDGCAEEKVLWKVANNDCSSRATASSVFDFEGDGKAEVVYADEKNFRIFDGTTGAILFDDASHGSNTRIEMPVIADVDNDGKAEVLVGSTKSNGGPRALNVWKDRQNNWVRTRRIWNQHSYHVTNVSEDGQIPRSEEPNWLNGRLNNFRQNIQPGGVFDAPDLLVENIELDTISCKRNAKSTPITVTVTNNGAIGIPAGLKVYLWAVDKQNVRFEIGVLTVDQRVLPGQNIRTVYNWVTDVYPSIFNIYAHADNDGDGNGAFNECNEDNNTFISEDISCLIDD